MKQTISCEWKGEMAFESRLGNHTVRMDADAESGGSDSGVRPKPLLLTALAGCSGMDVAAMLSKMRQPLSFFNMQVDAETSEEHPKTYTRIELVYQFKKSDGLDESKVEKAVKLSQEKYCGVSAMLKEASDLSFRIEYLD
ncbi:osmotically inducible protein C [Marispirochaeta aestuarii]|uniref:Osmotically inducible protein C n=1 Tax=Marispirochaeta aestuarii TaxID=1963862 RepID=A0A1Y1S276_9SPIO|nr:OsmC family protein [Marispirochaeta aestuarii]ORC37914.1 osmotically inducible protein C [Marispirochaeta aestuarii]